MIVPIEDILGALRVSIGLARIKWGNSDPDVDSELAKCEKVLSQLESTMFAGIRVASQIKPEEQLYPVSKYSWGQFVWPCLGDNLWGTNSGHGHVWLRPDGLSVRCGGPGLCSDCNADLFRYGSIKFPEEDRGKKTD